MGGDVDDGRQVEPTLAGRDVGEVATPAGAEGCRVRLEVAKDQVRAGYRVGMGDGGVMATSAVLACEAGFAHQSCDPAASAYGVRECLCGGRSRRPCRP